MTSITITDQYGTYTVTKNDDDMTIGDVIEYLVKPVLLACGYSNSNVKELFGEI